MASKPVVALSDDVLDCLSRLPQQASQKCSKFIMKFRSEPTSSGINFEKIHNAKDENFRSVRIDDNLRGIVLAPKTGNVYVLLWIDNHDDAYKWAQNRVARVNNESGALQVFSVDELTVTPPETTKPKLKGLFDDLKDRELLRLGVPEQLIPLTRTLKTDSDLEAQAKVYPPDAYDGLYMKVAGYSIEDVIKELDRTLDQKDTEQVDIASSLKSSESQRKFWVADDEEELQRMLDAPLEKWRVFLHPLQRNLVERDWNGPVRVLGGAGTGKTVAALHRAKWLAEYRFNAPNDKILLTTFTKNLAADIKENLRTICSEEQFARIDVINLDAWVYQFVRSRGESRTIVFPYDENYKKLWDDVMSEYKSGLPYEKSFYQDEWNSVIQTNAITTREQYLQVSRVGRGTRLDRRARAEIWKIFEAYRENLDEHGLLEADDFFQAASDILKLNKGAKLHPYKAVIVDEAQDIGPQAFRLIRQMLPEEVEGQPDKNSLFIVGDGHQAIYGKRVILGQCGINIVGRGRKLRVNYRTSEEIRRWAFAILDGIDINDLDEGQDDGRGYCSLFNGPEPEIINSKNSEGEFKKLLDWIRQFEVESEKDIQLGDICIIGRTRKEVKKIKEFLDENNYKIYELKRRNIDDRRHSGIRVATMHRVKGLEFKAVAIVSLNKDNVPDATSLKSAPDEATKEDILKSERMLLYVASTRAKNRLLVSSYGTPSSILTQD